MPCYFFAFNNGPMVQRFGAGGGGSAWGAWARRALAGALATAPLDLADVWALVLRYGVHGLLHAGDARNWSARGAGAALGLNPEPSPSPGLGLLLELVAEPVPSGASRRLRVRAADSEHQGLRVSSSRGIPLLPVHGVDKLSCKVVAHAPGVKAARLGVTGHQPCCFCPCQLLHCAVRLPGQLYALKLRAWRPCLEERQYKHDVDTHRTAHVFYKVLYN